MCNEIVLIRVNKLCPYFLHFSSDLFTVSYTKSNWVAVTLVNWEQWKLWPKKFWTNLQSELRRFFCPLWLTSCLKVLNVFAYLWRPRKSAQGIT